MTKECTACGQRRELAEFYAAKSSDGRSWQCKLCAREYCRRWRAAHPSYQRDWYEKNRDSARASARERRRRWNVRKLPQTRKCVACGTAFQCGGAGNGSGANNQQYCGVRCRKAAEYARCRERRMASPKPAIARPCRHCGEQFAEATMHRKLCSLTCRRKASYARRTPKDLAVVREWKRRNKVRVAELVRRYNARQSPEQRARQRATKRSLDRKMRASDPAYVARKNDALWRHHWRRKFGGEVPEDVLRMLTEARAIQQDLRVDGVKVCL